MFRSQQNVEAEKQGTLFQKKRREMGTAERVGMLQEKLYCKAKQGRGYKFYVLYDKVYRYYNRKSQRKSRLYGQQTFEILVSKYALIDPKQYFVKAHL